MEFLRERREYIADFVQDVTGLFSSGRGLRTLSEDQVKTLWEFKNACRKQLANGDSILKTIPPINEFEFGELRCAVDAMNQHVDNLELVLSGTKPSTSYPIAASLPGVIIGGAIGGASKGFLCGAPLAMVDAGILAGVCAIIGGLIGAATCSSNSNAANKKETQYLIGTLTRLVDDTKNVENLVRKAYGPL